MRSSDLRFGLIFFVTSVLVKLPYLGTFLTIDERRWIDGAGQFLLALHSGDLAQTYWHFHPGITITWGEAFILWLQGLWVTHGTLAEFVKFQTENLDLSVGTMRLSGVILTSVALPFVYTLANLWLGKWPAILGVGLIAVDPFWVAHSRIVNGDALAGILMLASVLSFALLLTKPDPKLAITAGVFVGLSFLTKLPSQILAPFIILLALIGYASDRNWRFWLKALLLCGLTSIVVFVVLWPAMWVAPVKTLLMMFEDTFSVGDIGGKDKVEFFAGTVRAEQSRFFYPLALSFRLTPINLIGSPVALVPLFKWNDGKPKRPTILLWLFMLSVIVLANMIPKKADRYAMSVIVTLDLVAGIGWIWLLQKVTVTRRIKAKIIMPALLVSGQFSFVLLNYPYVLTYYNPLLGGFAKATELVPVGRGEGLEQAAAWINSQPGGQLATTAPYYENVTNYYLAGKSLDWPKDGKKQLLADYVVFYITQTQRQLPYPGLVDYFQKQTPAYVVRHGQTPFVWVYKRQRPINALTGEAEIVGRAQIVGFYQSENDLRPGSSTEIILYLLTKDQVLPNNENFQVSLVDSLGNRHGVWQNAVDNQWKLNTIIEWNGKLTLPADLAPNDYRLRVALIDTNINSEVTSFPFEEEIVTVRP